MERMTRTLGRSALDENRTRGYKSGNCFNRLRASMKFVNKNEDINGSDAPERWHEDLFWQAERGFELGLDLCKCEGFYHPLWGLLRASRFDGNLRTEESAPFSAVLSPLMNDQARVLIGGAADPATLCILGGIASPREPRFTVVDQCRSPLRLIEEFSTAKGIDCATLHADIIDLDSAQQWDVIVLHYTASFVAPALRERFFNRLSEALTPGGTLVWVADNSRKRTMADTQEMERAWYVQAKNALHKSSFSLSYDRRVATMLRDYAAARTARRLNAVTPAEITDLMNACKLFPCREVKITRQQAIGGRPSTDIDVSSSVILSATKGMH